MRTCEFCKRKHYVAPYWQCDRCGAVLPDADDTPRPQLDEDAALTETDVEDEMQRLADERRPKI